LGRNSKKVALILIDIANAYRGQKRFHEAINALEKSISISLEVYGPESIQVAGVILCIAQVNVCQGRLRDALHLY
jgi:hypothetical protein